MRELQDIVITGRLDPWLAAPLVAFSTPSSSAAAPLHLLRMTAEKSDELNTLVKGAGLKRQVAPPCHRHPYETHYEGANLLSGVALLG